MKSFFLILAGSLLFFSLPAQQFTLSLQEEKLASPPKAFYLDDLIVAQREDSCLGVLEYGFGKRFTPVFFETNIHDALESFFKRSMPRETGLLPMVVRVNRIFIYDFRKTDKEYVTLQLSLSFIKRDSLTYTDLFTACVTDTRLLLYDEMTLQNMIVNAIGECFEQLYSRLQAGLIFPMEISSEKLRENVLLQPTNFRFTNPEPKKKGLYKTYFDFRDNTPDESYDFKVLTYYNEDDSRLNRYHLKFNGKEPKENIWGFSDGTSVYKHTKRYNILLTPDSIHNLTAWARVEEDPQEIIAPAVIGGILFGVLGAAIFGGISAASIDYSKVIKMNVDLFDGRLIPEGTPDYTMISSTLVLFLSKVSDPEEPVKVFIKDKQVCELTPGKYCQLDLCSRYSTADFKFITYSGSELTLKEPVKLCRTEAYLLRVKKNKSIFHDRLHDQMRYDIIKAKTKENTVCTVELFSH